MNCFKRLPTFLVACLLVLGCVLTEAFALDAASVCVATAEELEHAIAQNAEQIQITQDLTVDRTIYITKNTTIFSRETVVLTRSPDFVGDSSWWARMPPAPR